MSRTHLQGNLETLDQHLWVPRRSWWKEHPFWDIHSRPESTAAWEQQEHPQGFADLGQSVCSQLWLCGQAWLLEHPGRTELCESQCSSTSLSSSGDTWQGVRWKGVRKVCENIGHCCPLLFFGLESWRVEEASRCSRGSSQSPGLPESTLGKATSLGPRVPSCSARCRTLRVLTEMRRLVVEPSRGSLANLHVESAPGGPCLTAREWDRSRSCWKAALSEGVELHQARTDC